MSKKFRLVLIALVVLGVISTAVWYLHGTNIAVLNPKGPVALKERNLIIFGSLLSLVVVIPVFTITFTFAWRYREGNTKAKYSPDLDHNRIAETIWWLIPSILILILSIVAWNSSHELDPFKPLASNNKPLTIQVIALDWKWLFIYPQQGIASVNFFQFPEQTPLNFEITSDTVMNSFWIPQLGGQIYAMPGMSTQLHLMASVPGSFNGSSANISGVGFSGMTFVARSSSQSSFNAWVKSVKKSAKTLNQAEYNRLAEPSENNPISYYSSEENGLYNEVVYKYMTPINQTPSTGNNGYTVPPTTMQGMEMQ